MKLNQVYLAGLAALALAGSTLADDNRPGSLMVFPEFNNQQGVYQILTLTNTDAKSSVTVEIVYIDGDTCQEFNRNIELTPLDTFSCLTSAHNPEMVRGYAYAFAKDGPSGDAISFNHLVGSSLSISVLAPVGTTNPFVFQGVGNDGDATDANDNGLRDLDGTEYSEAPDRVIIPRFTGQHVPFVSDLILIGLTGGAEFSTTIDLLIYNDNEQGFSAEYTFQCWAKVYLWDISQAFDKHFLQDQTNSDSGEVFGADGNLEHGWFELSGAIASSRSTSLADPSVLAVLNEGLIVVPSMASSLPFSEGTRATGSLLARSMDGTF